MELDECPKPEKMVEWMNTQMNLETQEPVKDFDFLGITLQWFSYHFF